MALGSAQALTKLSARAFFWKCRHKIYAPSVLHKNSFADHEVVDILRDNYFLYLLYANEHLLVYWFTEYQNVFFYLFWNRVFLIGIGSDGTCVCIIIQTGTWCFRLRCKRNSIKLVVPHYVMKRRSFVVTLYHSTSVWRYIWISCCSALTATSLKFSLSWLCSSLAFRNYVLQTKL